VRALILSLLLLSAARADVLFGARPEARMGAGYDDNLFLDPSTLLPTQPPSDAAKGDAIIDIEPSFLAWLEGRGHRLVLDVDYLERITPTYQDLRDATITLGWRSAPLGPISFLVGGRYEHWGTDFYKTDDFDLGGVDGAIRAQLGSRVAVEALYRFGARNYTERVQLDLDHRLRASVGVRAARWLHLEAAYAFWHITSNEGTADLDRHRGELSLAFQPLSWLSILAAYSIAYQRVPMPAMGMGMGMGNVVPPRTDYLNTFDLVVSAQPLRWLEIFARYSLLYSISPGDPTADYHRNQLLAGVAVSWDFTHHRRTALPYQPLIRGHAVTFRHHARPGQSVAVTGDWNSWSPQPLGEGKDGMYEATYNLPPGRHEYSFVVDGNPSEPADAPSYVPDGFGGRSAVLYLE
jgi:hypothetical protein